MMEGMSLCNECFFYEFTDKSCAKEIEISKKGEKCHSFAPLVMVSLYDDSNDGEDEEVPSSKRVN